jgi:plastocyanin
MSAILFTAGCGAAGGYSTGPSMGGGTGNDSVSIVNDAFSPATVHPDSNGQVVWTWKSGGVAHNVTFEDAITGSGTKSSGTFTQTFANPGSYRFRCTIHSSNFSSGMHGVVVVP